VLICDKFRMRRELSFKQIRKLCEGWGKFEMGPAATKPKPPPR